MSSVQGTHPKALERQPSTAPFKPKKEDGYYVYVAGVIDVCCLILFLLGYLAVVAAVVATRIYSGRHNVVRLYNACFWKQKINLTQNRESCMQVTTFSGCLRHGPALLTRITTGPQLEPPRLAHSTR